ncbi:MAG TPA: anti-sigma regulatory factor [Gemmatimonadales bacterium]|nr:anti-sigma regulatory factor [Gemmatimonadales bacterium]
MSSSPAGSESGDCRAKVVRVEDPSQVGEARRVAVALALALGFAEAERSDIAIVVTEAATNLVRHGGGGRVLLQPTPTGPGGLELLCLDRGPGMANFAECLRDGYSTAGTPGNGLGAIARLAHDFDAYSRPGLGTALLCRFRLGEGEADARSVPRAAVPRSPTGVVSLPIAGETHCGDSWAVARTEAATLVLVVDGLGHGPEAEVAAEEAVRLFHDGVRAGQLAPAPLLDRVHRGLRATRGAAAAIAALRPDDDALRYAGIGNIAAVVAAPGARLRHLVSHSGILGHQARKIDEFAYAWPAGAQLVMHSDGLQTRWQLDDYPALALRDPALVAGVLWRDYSRERDDVTVLVHRRPPRAAAGGA